VDKNGDITILGVTYEGTKGLWELLTRVNVDRSLVKPYDVRSYKRILESTNGNLSYNDPSGHIKSIRGPKYRDVISKLFPTESRRRNRQRQRSMAFRQWTNYITIPRNRHHSHRGGNSRPPPWRGAIQQAKEETGCCDRTRKLCIGLRGIGFPGIPTVRIMWLTCGSWI
jgi:hypothetical protein